MLRLGAVLCMILISSSPLAFANWEFDGRFAVTGRGFPSSSTAESVPKGDDLQRSGPLMELQPSVQVAGRNTRFKMKFWALADGTFSSAKDRALVIPEEFFLETRRGFNNWVLGMNTVTWGVTDLVNPLDVVNTASFRSLLSPRKIGSPMLSWTHARDAWSVDLVWVPQQIKPILPPPSSRDWPRAINFKDIEDQLPEENARLVAPTDGIRFEIQSPLEERRPFSDNVGLRLKTIGDTVETQWVAFEGHPGFPGFSFVARFDLINFAPPTYQLRPVIELTPSYQRVRVGGGSFVWTLGSWLVKGVYAEVHRTHPDLEISLPRTSVLSAERSFGWGSLENTFLLQGVWQREANPNFASSFSIREVFDQSISLGLRMASGIDWSILWAGLYNPRSQSSVAQIDAQYRWSDSTQLQLVGQSLNGPEGSLLKLLQPASRVDLSVVYTW